jgi:hypothetical protein
MSQAVLVDWLKLTFVRSSYEVFEGEHTDFVSGCQMLIEPTTNVKVAQFPATATKDYVCSCNIYLRQPSWPRHDKSSRTGPFVPLCQKFAATSAKSNSSGRMSR